MPKRKKISTTEHPNHGANRKTFIQRIKEGILAYKPTEPGVYKLIQGMTNWQNYKWLQAGGKRDPVNVAKYANMKRR